MDYSEKLRKPAWQKRRLKILERDGWKCTLCNDTDTELQVHHKKYTGEPHEAPDEDLITVCKWCHEIVEMFIKYGAKHPLFAVAINEMAKLYCGISNNNGMPSFLLACFDETPYRLYAIKMSAIHELNDLIKKHTNG
jgi:hypothetical protein